MVDEKLYSISDIAKLTKLTDRTIRNYLASGTLKGKKIGGQWRFTQEDINALFHNDDFADDMLTKTEKNIDKYIKNEFSFIDKNNACIILNFIIKEKEKRKALFDKIRQIPTDDDKKEKISFIEKDGKIKMIIIASFSYISKICDLLKDVIL